MACDRTRVGWTQFFPNSQLGGDASMFSQLRLGAIQFFLISSGNLASVVPPVDIENLGFTYASADEGAHVIDGPLGEYLRRETAAKGIHTLRAIWNSGIAEVISNALPIRTPDDLRAFKIRTTDSKILVDLSKRLGASPTPLSIAETYTALQTKLIDGESLSVGSTAASRHYEVIKYISLTNHSWAGPSLIVNGEAWKRLPPDLQAPVERLNTKYALIERRDIRLNDAALSDKLARQGIIFNRTDPAAFRARLGTYYETWPAEFGSTAWEMLLGSLGRRLG